MLYLNINGLWPVTQILFTFLLLSYREIFIIEVPYFSLQHLSFYISAKKAGFRKLFVIGLGKGGCIEIQRKKFFLRKKNEGHKMWNNYRCRIIWQIDIYKNNSVIPGEVGCLEMHYRNSIEKSMQDNLKIEFANLNHSKNLWY